MKKIGLCVCYDTKNFGSQLQVLATDKKIKELGYDTEIIRYQKKLSPAFAVQTFPRFFNPYFIKGKMTARKRQNELARHKDTAEKVAVRNKRFDAFVTKYFTNLSEPYIGWEKLKEKSSTIYDAFLCGSDQLWLPSNLGSHFYTLEFAPDDKPKIAYATSFGVSEIPGFQKKRTSRYLNRFQALSTRELNGAKIIEELTGKKVQVVCDPTLLFDAKSWAELILDKKLLNKPYIFCYFLGTNMEHRKAAQKFSEKTGLKIVTCPFLDNYMPEDEAFGDVQMFDMDATDFVNLIRHAEYILTDSFHGSVFSILNHKKFVTFNRFGNEKGSRNSRIDSLCALLGLNERRYQGDILTQATREIDYFSVDLNLEKLRSDSIAYLKESIEKV